MSHVRDSEDPFLYLGNPLILCPLTCCVAPRSDPAELSVQAGYEMDEKKKKKKKNDSRSKAEMQRMTVILWLSNRQRFAYMALCRHSVCLSGASIFNISLNQLINSSFVRCYPYFICHAMFPGNEPTV